ncbi:MAG: hypothetical protein MUC87_18895 [Bacteroidia bacterium]|jgi:hypothetical protein|nr:hypothetical protein [Bacteroidia bacterium]
MITAENIFRYLPSWQHAQLKEATTSTARLLYYEEENLVYIEPFAGVVIDVPQAMENREAKNRLTGGIRKTGMLVNYNVDMSTTPAMRALCATADYNSGVYAIALVSALAHMKIAGNFYLRINRPVVATRFFNSIQPAQKWLITQGLTQNLSIDG